MRSVVLYVCLKSVKIGGYRGGYRGGTTGVLVARGVAESKLRGLCVRKCDEHTYYIEQQQAHAYVTTQVLDNVIVI